MRLRGGLVVVSGACLTLLATGCATFLDEAAPTDAANPEVWFDDRFALRRPIAVENPNGPLADPLLAFPVPVRLPPLGDNAVGPRGSGVAIVADDHETGLAFEVETIGDNGGLLWVRADLTDDDTRFWIYYAADDKSLNESDPAQTFSDFHGVYHFSDSFDIGGMAGNAAGDPPMVSTNLSSNQSESAFGRGLTIAPETAGYLEAADDRYLVGDGEALMIEVWLKADDIETDDFHVVYDNQTACTGYNLKLIGQNPPGQLRGRFIHDSQTICSATSDVVTSDSITDGDWHHVAQVIDRSAGTLALFVDGVEIGATTIPTDMNSSPPGTGFRVGAKLDGGSDFQSFDGEIDELRLRPPPPDPAAWARASYRLGRPYPGGSGAADVEVGEPQPRPEPE